MSSTTDDFDYDMIAGHNVMHVVYNGLRIDLTEYRRGTGQAHFIFMQWLDDRSWALGSCIDAAKTRDPRTQRSTQSILVMSHKTRMAFNAKANAELARMRHDTREIKAPCVPQRLHGESASRHAHMA